MLPNLNLDDRMFEQIVSNARKGIPKWLPEWTDENAHDPGITLIELFAWITEMQQYYLNRISVPHQLKFLKLLGAKQLPSASSRVQVQFGNISSPLLMPRGTKLLARDLSFETEESAFLHPARLDRVVVRTDQEANDYSAMGETAGVSFYAFGEEAKKGSRLYLALDRALSPGETLTLTLKLSDDSPIKPETNPAEAASIIPSARVSWKFYGSEEDGLASSWLPAEVLKDETMHLTYSGQLVFRIPAPMRPVMVHPANDRIRYWLCCTVEETGYERSPKVEQVVLNTVKAIQKDTQSETFLFTSTGLPAQTLQVQSFLALYEAVKVQVWDVKHNGWRYWREVDSFEQAEADEHCYIKSIDEQQAAAVIRFGDGRHGAVPTEGEGRIRVIAHNQSFDQARYLAASSGLPHQSVPVYDFPLQKGRFALQIGRLIQEDGGMIWEDWHRIDDLQRSSPHDKHYTFDEDSREIRFGDNERGSLPPSGYGNPNLCLTYCEFGGGTKGNIKAGLISGFAHPRLAESKVTVSNPFYADGGRDRESLAECIERVQKEMREPFRAVTAEDTEYIVLNTPGLRVARAKAIPLYTVGLKDYPRNQASGQLTVAVVPFSESRTPQPSTGFLQTIKNHLDERRLITTQVHVVPAEYVKVTVNAIIVVEPHFSEEKEKVLRALYEMLKPQDSDRSKGWEFGRAVYKGDIYGMVSKIPGVAYIQDLWIEASGRNIHKNAGGDVFIPPHGLVYSGEHEVELISRTDL